MNKRKIAALVLSAALLTGLAACTDVDDSGSTTDPEVTVSDDADYSEDSQDLDGAEDAVGEDDADTGGAEDEVPN